MKKIFLSLFVLLFVHQILWARPLDDPRLAQMRMSGELRDLMGRMIVAMADLDILINRDRVTDWEIFKNDAVTILETIQKIRTLDKTDYLKSDLDRLQAATDVFHQQTLKKDKKAVQSFQALNEVCLSCHQAHRDKKR